MSDRSILVCFALPDEARFFKHTAAAEAVRILIHGIGKQNAECSIRAAIATSKPDLVLTCGFAGGLKPQFDYGEVLFATNDNPELRNRLSAAGARAGTFHCADSIAVTAEEKRALWRHTGADAVEMESGIIHVVCREQNIPCATVRVISDIADDDLPLDFNALAKPDQSLDFGKLAFAIAKSPGKIPALIRLGRQTSTAAKKLAEVLQKIIAA